MCMTISPASQTSPSFTPILQRVNCPESLKILGPLVMYQSSAWQRGGSDWHEALRTRCDQKTGELISFFFFFHLPPHPSSLRQTMYELVLAAQRYLVFYWSALHRKLESLMSELANIALPKPDIIHSIYFFIDLWLLPLNKFFLSEQVLLMLEIEILLRSICKS